MTATRSTAYVFNPPPGWPQMPAGWVPSADFVPDPSWPPVPADWQWWVLPPVAAAPAVPAAPLVQPPAQEQVPAPQPVYETPVPQPAATPAPVAQPVYEAPVPQPVAAQPVYEQPQNVQGWDESVSFGDAADDEAASTPGWSVEEPWEQHQATPQPQQPVYEQPAALYDGRPDNGEAFLAPAVYEQQPVQQPVFDQPAFEPQQPAVEQPAAPQNPLYDGRLDNGEAFNSAAGYQGQSAYAEPAADPYAQDNAATFGLGGGYVPPVGKGHDMPPVQSYAGQVQQPIEAEPDLPFYKPGTVAPLGGFTETPEVTAPEIQTPQVDPNSIFFLEPAGSHSKRLKKNTRRIPVLIGIVLVALLAAVGLFKAASGAEPPVPAPAAAPAVGTVGEWTAAGGEAIVEGLVTNLNLANEAVKTDDPLRLTTACNGIRTEVDKGKAFMAIPDAAVNAKWTQGLDRFGKAADACTSLLTGFDDAKAKQMSAEIKAGLDLMKSAGL